MLLYLQRSLYRQTAQFIIFSAIQSHSFSQYQYYYQQYYYTAVPKQGVLVRWCKIPRHNQSPIMITYYASKSKLEKTSITFKFGLPVVYILMMRYEMQVAVQQRVIRHSTTVFTSLRVEARVQSREARAICRSQYSIIILKIIGAKSFWKTGENT